MFLAYLRRHYKIIIMLAAFALIFAGVFSLYSLPLEAVLYSAILCLAVGSGLFAVGYSRYMKRHRELKRLLNSADFSLEGLPEPAGALEEDYQQLLRVVSDAKARSEAASDSARRELTDYYTLWAHQIKTPIAAMRLLLQREDTRLNSELGSELFRIEEYVGMVLSYTRLGSDTTDYVFRRYSLDDIVRSCLRKYSRLFIIKRVSLSFEPTELMVYSDDKWLSFVIEQLLSNALKYTPEGGKIAVSARGRSLIIADTGIGIRTEDLPRVFDKGFTGYNGRENKKSTGVGLYLCKRICDRLGHAITISSVPGEGTRASIAFGVRENAIKP